MKSFHKNIICKLLCSIKIDSLFRLINKKKLLIICYHNIQERESCPPLFTHLPVDIFRSHLQFLKKYYNLISLDDLITFQSAGKPFPERAALITFDDGFMNNYNVAFPVLKEFAVPAVIFLTTDYVGTEKLLWFDELYLLIRNASSQGVTIEEIEEIFNTTDLPRDDNAAVYSKLSCMLKYSTLEARNAKIVALRNKVGPFNDLLAEKFKLLSWEQIREMKNSGLIDFGVHTATHRIVSQLSEAEWDQEIIAPIKVITNEMNCKIAAFCYPNGIPDIDFTSLHEEFLKKAGYVCSFSTGEWLNSWHGDFFRLGRKTVGNDVTSAPYFFRINTAGLPDVLHPRFFGAKS